MARKNTAPAAARGKIHVRVDLAPDVRADVRAAAGLLDRRSAAAWMAEVVGEAARRVLAAHGATPQSAAPAAK